jgi:hypothetical protein
VVCHWNEFVQPNGLLAVKVRFNGWLVPVIAAWELGEMFRSPTVIVTLFMAEFPQTVLTS